MKKYTSSHPVYIKIFIKIIKCFSNFIPINIDQNNLNEDDINVVIDDICSDKNFQRSDFEKETFDNKEDLNYPKKTILIKQLLLFKMI